MNEQDLKAKILEYVAEFHDDEAAALAEAAGIAPMEEILGNFVMWLGDIGAVEREPRT